jgi:hypothetical protein
VEKFCRVGQATDDNIMRRMHIACRIPKATNTRTGCEILIAFPPRQWLRERVSLLRYTYIASLVKARSHLFLRLAFYNYLINILYLLLFFA